ncbi:MAG: dihydroxyacetone kinase subunit L [Tannerellaceae bacterium]|nr:dihydroxyacetone kinase subunit L [Tannerellaceae bacterium]
MEEFTTETLISWCRKLADTYQQKKDELTELDRQIGDADHGLNMARGFTAVATKVEGMEDKDLGTVFKTIAMTLISTVGGASGPLYGSLFLQAAVKANGKNTLNTAGLYDALNAGVQNVMARGKAVKGDKTMVDALLPAMEAFDKAKDGELTVALDEARKGAEQGAQSTVPLVAKKGRASYLGERSKDHMDPGAASTVILFDTLYQTVIDN